MCTRQQLKIASHPFRPTSYEKYRRETIPRNAFNSPPKRFPLPGYPEKHPDITYPAKRKAYKKMGKQSLAGLFPRSIHKDDFFIYKLYPLSRQ